MLRADVAEARRRIDAKVMRCASAAGGTGGIPNTSTTATTQPDERDGVRRRSSPIQPISTPAIAGPTTRPRLLYRPVSAAAAGSCSIGTSRGVTERTAPAPSENDDQASDEHEDERGAVDAEARHGDERSGRDRDAGVAGDEDAAAVVAVGERAADDRQRDERDELRDREQADREASTR